jgi:hypothetical protein
MAGSAARRVTNKRADGVSGRSGMEAEMSEPTNKENEEKKRTKKKLGWD